MSLLPDLIAGQIGLVIGPRAERMTMLELSALLALRGSVRVLDGGNSYNALYGARTIRRHTIRLNETINQITVARAFTCYQLITLLEETATSASSVQAVSPYPTLVLDLLSTFYDESVSVPEAYRLLHLVVEHLHRLRRLAPVIVSLRPPPLHQPDRAGFNQPLEAIADLQLVYPPDETAVYQPNLF